MRFLAWLFLATFLGSIGLSAVEIPAGLRTGALADAATLQTAVSMRGDGWYYIMPRPKSGQASWGNPDGRTTWWEGYWENRLRGETSRTQPTRIEQGWKGDGEAAPGWRRGGSPPPPSLIEWLLSEEGGVPPES